MLYDRNWREFWLDALRGLKTVGMSSAYVPIFFILLNPNFKDPNFLSTLLITSRIGLQIAIFSWASFILVYAHIYYHRPKDLPKFKQSIKMKVIFGISFILIGLILTSLTEPFISGNSFGLKNISVGALIGTITFVLSVLYVAYKNTLEINLKLKVESAEANLHVMNNQMQPHFLFNTLNSLAELIDSDKNSAAEMTLKLSDLYRQILNNSKKTVSSLDSELEIINKYLELEQLRFGNRISFSISTPPDTSNIYLPSLALQTLIENSIKHGISKS